MPFLAFLLSTAISITPFPSRCSSEPPAGVPLPERTLCFGTRGLLTVALVPGCDGTPARWIYTDANDEGSLCRSEVGGCSPSESGARDALSSSDRVLVRVQPGERDETLARVRELIANVSPESPLSEASVRWLREDENASSGGEEPPGASARARRPDNPQWMAIEIHVRGDDEAEVLPRRLWAPTALLELLEETGLQAEPDWLVRVDPSGPNDPLHTTGDWLDKIRTPWSELLPAGQLPRSVKVAVIDDGFVPGEDVPLPELAGTCPSPATAAAYDEVRYCSAPASSTACCGACFGTSCASTPGCPAPSRDVGGGYVACGATNHGAAVAGLLAATTHNSLATASVAGGTAHLVPVRVPARFCQDHNALATSDLISAIRWAADSAKADVIVMAMGTYCVSAAMVEEIGQREEALFVVSAGNEDNDIGLQPRWPASLPFHHVLTVGATFSEVFVPGLKKAGGSNFGHPVDISAPVNPSSIWHTGTGTSFSTPLAAGAAVLIKSRRAPWKPRDVRCAITTAIATDDPYTPAAETAITSIPLLNDRFLDVGAALSWRRPCSLRRWLGYPKRCYGSEGTEGLVLPCGLSLKRKEGTWRIQFYDKRR